MMPAVEQRPLRPTITVESGYSISFTFLVKLAMSPHSAIDVAAMASAIEAEEPDAYRALVQPAASFLADIVLPSADGSGLPLVIALEPAPDAGGSRPLEVRRPEQIRYESEGRTVALARERGGAWMAFDFRDTFAVFGSGWLGYTLTLIPCRTAPAVVDAYDVILFQKLAYPTEACTHVREHLRWRTPGEHDWPLVDFANVRLQRLQQVHAPDTPSGVRMVLDRLDLAATPSFDWGDLHSLCVMLDHADVYDHTERLCGSLSRLAPEVPASAGNGGAGHGAAGAGAVVLDETALGIAGIAQGILDFGSQDQAELADSLVPIQRANGFVMFGHPRFFIQMCVGSRSRRMMENFLGTCPYVLLSHLVVAHNEAALRHAELVIARLEYQPSRPRTIRRSLFDLQRTIDATDFVLVDNTTPLLRANLRTRLEVFRALYLNHIPNVFRYPTERRTYDELSALRGLSARHEALVDRLERYEAMVSDLHDVTARSAERKINFLLLVLALLTIVSAATDLVDLREHGHLFGAVGGVVILLCGVVALLLVARLALPAVLERLRATGSR